jgi:hypothetical protein
MHTASGMTVNIPDSDFNAGSKRQREENKPSKDDLAISEGVQSFGKGFIGGNDNIANKRLKKQDAYEDDMQARNSLLDAQLLLDGGVTNLDLVIFIIEQF